jgi:predicted DNA binding CopG/RHH family protein
MANSNKKPGTHAKPKAVSAVTHLEDWVAQETSAASNLTSNESVKTAQAAKKEGKTKRVQVQEPAPEVALEVAPEPAAAELPPVKPSADGKAGKAKAGKVKAEKAKEVKTKEVKAKEVKAQAAVEPAIAGKKSEPEPEKPAKMKRLTLDIAKPLHKAIKAKAVEEGIPMLRSLLEKHYGT